MATFGGIRGLAQAFLRSAAEKGLAFGQAFDAMKVGGMPTYRRTDMLADYRQYLGIPEKADTLKYIRMDYSPSREHYTITKGYQRSPLRYQVNIDTHNPVTGKTFTMSTNVVSDTPLSRRQIEEAGVEAVKKTVDDYKDDIVGVVLYGAFAKEGEYWD